MECALLEKHHWDYLTLNETDIEDITAYLTYYPEWQRRINLESAAPAPIVKKSIDEVDWM